METTFKGYGLQQFAIGNAAKFRAMASLAMDIVASVGNWDGAPKAKSKAECLSALSMAMTLAKVPATSAERIGATVSGLCLYLGRDYGATIAQIKAAFADGDNGMQAEEAVNLVCAAMQADGIENLSFLEAYARKGSVGLAAIKAETEAKIADAEKRAAFTAEEAKAAAETEAKEAKEKADDATPRGKAAKQAGAILSSLAKHGDLMTDIELNAIVGLIAEKLKARLSVADDLRAKDLATAAQAKAEAAIEARETAQAIAAGEAKAA